MSVSAPYLEATVTTPAAARERGDLEVLVNMSQMTANRYDRLTHDVEAVLGRPATGDRDFVARHAASFAS